MEQLGGPIVKATAAGGFSKQDICWNPTEHMGNLGVTCMDST